MDKMITVKALPTASRHTRNRLREHGPRLEVMRVDTWPELGGVCWMLGTPLGMATGERAWFGWIPQRECEVCE
jgi:hypothetical protein